MVKDIISNSKKNLKKHKIKNLRDIKKNNSKIINFSENFQKIDNEIKKFLRVKMYNNKKVLSKIFCALLAHGEIVPNLGKTNKNVLLTTSSANKVLEISLDSISNNSKNAFLPCL